MITLCSIFYLEIITYNAQITLYGKNINGEIIIKIIISTKVHLVQVLRTCMK